MFNRSIRPPEAAETIGVTTKTLANWRNLKIGPTYYKLGRLIYYTENDLDNFLHRKSRKFEIPEAEKRVKISFLQSAGKRVVNEY